MKDQDFVLLGVNSDEPETARKAVAENELNWRSFRNEREGRPSISEEWCVEGWPTLVVLDREMRIRYRGHGGDAAMREVRKLLGVEAPVKKEQEEE